MHSILFEHNHLNELCHVRIQSISEQDVKVEIVESELGMFEHTVLCSLSEFMLKNITAYSFQSSGL